MSTNATYIASKADDRLNSRVEVIGHRDGFTYIRFEDGTATKVPASWVKED